MHLKPIHNDDDYALALQEIDRLWDAADGTPEADTLEILVTLVEAYEKGRYELPLPDPIEALEYFLESRGWTRGVALATLGHQVTLLSLVGDDAPGHQARAALATHGIADAFVLSTLPATCQSVILYEPAAQAASAAQASKTRRNAAGISVMSGQLVYVIGAMPSRMMPASRSPCSFSRYCASSVPYD